MYRESIASYAVFFMLKYIPMSTKEKKEKRKKKIKAHYYVLQSLKRDDQYYSLIS